MRQFSTLYVCVCVSGLAPKDRVIRPYEWGANGNQPRTKTKGKQWELTVECRVRATAVLNTFLAQNSHEELLTNQGKDAEAKESEDHHIYQFLHGAQQGAYDDLQT